MAPLPQVTAERSECVFWNGLKNLKSINFPNDHVELLRYNTGVYMGYGRTCLKQKKNNFEEGTSKLDPPFSHFQYYKHVPAAMPVTRVWVPFGR